jgi:hypothetical protein
LLLFPRFGFFFPEEWTALPFPQVLEKAPGLVIEIPQFPFSARVSPLISELAWGFQYQNLLKNC